MILEAKNISFQYSQKERVLFEGLNLKIESTQRVGILAKSGFGKTSLCKVLAGYEKPTTGEVLLDGKPLSNYKGYSPVQMIWQHPEQVVNPRLKLKDILLDGGKVEPYILEGLGIEEDWLQRYPSELSGGELQRFCIARALKAPTKFLLADEITTMLDLITQSQIWSFLLEEVQKREIGLLAVSHHLPLMEQVCTNFIDLEKKLDI